MIKLFKKLSAVICAGAIACSMLAFNTFAETKRCLVNDDAISSSDASEIEDILDKASDKQGIEFMALYINDSSIPDSQVAAIARTYVGKLSDGAVMINNAGSRYTYVAFSGKAKEKITDKETSKIVDNYVNKKFKDRDNVGAAEAFTKGVKRYMSFLNISPLVIAIGLGCFLIFFLITYFSVRAKYKFHEKPNTGAYLEGGDLNYEVMEDVFVSEHTSRTSISSGSGGSGGSSHSGGGGGHY